MFACRQVARALIKARSPSSLTGIVLEISNSLRRPRTLGPGQSPRWLVVESGARGSGNDHPNRVMRDRAR